MFRVNRLKKIVDKYKKTHTKEIGDYRASKCVVIPIKEIFSESCYALFDWYERKNIFNFILYPFIYCHYGSVKFYR